MCFLVYSWETLMPQGEWSGCCGSHACSQQRKSEMIITPFWCIGKGHELTNSVIHDPCVRGEWQMIDNIFPHCFWQVACGRRDQSLALKCPEISAQGKKAAANTVNYAPQCLRLSEQQLCFPLGILYSKCSIFQSIQHPLLFPDAPVCSGYWISYWNAPSEDHAFFSRDFQ